MAFMDLKITVSEKYKFHLILLSFSFYCLLVFAILIDEKLHCKLLAFEEGSIEHFSWGRIWLHGFDSVFSQVLIEFFV